MATDRSWMENDDNGDTDTAGWGEAVPVIGGLFGANREAEARRNYLAALKKLSGAYDEFDGDSALSKLGGLRSQAANADDYSLDQQKDVMSQLQEYGKGKLGYQDLANLSQIQSAQNTQNRAHQGAILQDANRRGALNSGDTLAAQLMGNQNSANQSGQQMLGVLGNAQSRALQSLAAGGNLATNMQQQAFGRNSSADSMNKYNQEMINRMFSNKLGLRDRQVGGRQALASGHLTSAMDSSKQMAGLRNGIIDPLNVVLDSSSSSGSNSQHSGTSYANGNGDEELPPQDGEEKKGGGVIGGLLSLLSDERVKDNILPASPVDSFSKMSPVSYNYLWSPEKEQLGILAQDAEKAGLGKTFVRTDKNGNKVIDTMDAFSALLAVATELSQRVIALESKLGAKDE